MVSCFFSNDDDVTISSFVSQGDAVSYNNPSYYCKTCGHYIVHRDLNLALKTKSSPFSEQSMVNCAYKCLEIGAENPDGEKIPFWVSRLSKNSILRTLEDPKLSSKYVVCFFEDVCNELINHGEKPKLLLKQVAEKLNAEGKSAFQRYEVREEDRVLAKIANWNELAEIADYLQGKRFLVSHGTVDKPIVSLTLDGWDSVWQNNLSVNSNKAFIAIQFDWKKESALKDGVVEAIKHACSTNGYEANIVSQNHTDNITNQIIAEIKKSKFLIAEFTYNNRGVYFEAGLAKGLGIPAFHLVKKGYATGKDENGEKIHFDIQQVMYKEWETPETLERELTDWIAATIGPYGLPRT